MKILMVTNTYLPIVGGLEKSIQSFTEKFREWGHETFILTPEFEGMESHEPGVIKLPSIHHFRKTDFSVALPLPGLLNRIVKSFNPDVIHAHHPFLMGEMAFRLAAQQAKPLVFTYHIMFNQYAHYLSLPRALSKRFLVELAAGFANLSSRVIAPSESVKEILQEEGVTAPIDVVPTGIDVSFFASGDGKKVRRDLGIPEKAFVMGYLGRFAPEKNLEFLTRAVIRFMRENSRAHFMLVGKGPSKEAVRKLFREAGMGNRLHVIGAVRGKPLVDCYHAMNVFVFASKSETQGMVLCEAMAAGVPVAALDGPGVREVVKDSENGRLLSREEESKFQSALSWCARRPSSEWKKMKQNARRTALRFSSERCARRALKVYETARGECAVPRSIEKNEWRRLIRRLGAEWKIMENFGRATRLALKEMMMG